METIKKEVLEVKELGDRIGYGHLMTIASALWRKLLKDSGTPETGAFVPTIYPFLNKDGKDNQDKEMLIYDQLVNETLNKISKDNYNENK